MPLFAFKITKNTDFTLIKAILLIFLHVAPSYLHPSGTITAHKQHLKCNYPYYANYGSEINIGVYIIFANHPFTPPFVKVLGVGLNGIGSITIRLYDPEN